MRHRISIQDGAMILVVVLVAAFLAFECDLYVQSGSAPAAEKSIELDEALTLAALFVVGLLVFSIRRYREQKRETRRRIKAEQQIRQIAFQDALTGLANRRRFDDALRVATQTPPAASAVHAVLLFDLNGFKNVNDLYGHGIGDEVLMIVAQRSLDTVGESCLAARFGGDEFAVLAMHLPGAEAASNIARRLLQAIEQPIETGHVTSRISAGIGIALLPTDADRPVEALRKADVALYRAKAERRGTWRFFEESMDQQIRERERVERDLRLAVERGDIQAWYQPSIDLHTRAVAGFEVIPRWVHAELGEVPAERFMPIAEDCGLTYELTTSLLRSACIAAVRWPAGVQLSINVAPGLLRQADARTQGLRDRIVAILAETGFTAERLELEVDESVLVQDLDAVREALHGLRELGVKIAVGKFGTGYSSLYHLRNFSLDKIKIDRSFIESMQSEARSVNIVSALVGLAQGLGLSVSADGISDPSQQDSLLDIGCQQGQFYNSPVSVDETLGFFR